MIQSCDLHGVHTQLPQKKNSPAIPATSGDFLPCCRDEAGVNHHTQRRSNLSAQNLARSDDARGASRRARCRGLHAALPASSARIARCIASSGKSSIKFPSRRRIAAVLPIR